jgi:hypothetical protein
MPSRRLGAVMGYSLSYCCPRGHHAHDQWAADLVPRMPSATSSVRGCDPLGRAHDGGGWFLAADVMSSVSTRVVLAPERIARGKSTEPTHAPDAVETRRLRRRISLGDVIFRALCILITGFVILVLGMVGGFYLYVTS